MKKRVLIALAISMIIGIGGCGTIEESVENTIDSQTTEEELSSDTNNIDTDFSSILEPEVESKNDVSTILEYDFSSAKEFSEGLAWVSFEKEGQPYFGCIDKTGELKFYYEGEPVYQGEPFFASLHEGCTDFENGYAYIYMPGELGVDCYVIDTDGVVIDKFIPGDLREKKVCAYGGGYKFVCYTEASFDSYKETYVIEDAYGNVVNELSFSDDDTPQNVEYVGDGVFYYKLEYGTYFYIAKSNKVLGPGTNFFSIDMIDGYSMVSHEFPYEQFTYCDAEGNCKEIRFPDKYSGYSLEYISTSNGYFLFEDTDAQVLVTYNAKEDIFSEYTGQYMQYLDGRICMKNGVLALRLLGKDDNEYFCLIDENMNEITEPIKAWDFNIYGNHIFAYDEESVKVFDLEGTMCGEIAEYQLPSFGEDHIFFDDPDVSIWYGDGLYKEYNQEQNSYKYFEANGSVVVDKIVDSNAQLMMLK